MNYIDNFKVPHITLAYEKITKDWIITKANKVKLKYIKSNNN